jgi:hypothetical protein
MSPFRSILASTVLLAMVSPSAHSQSATAVLSGVVTDPQNHVVTDAKVTITDLSRNLRRETVTNGMGAFTFSDAPPSQYRLTVAHVGFAEAELPKVTLHVNDDLDVQVKLQIATRQEQVIVSAEAFAVSDKSSVSTVVNRQFIENQPLNGRSFQTLVELSPGIDLTPSTLPTAGQFSAAGQRTSSNYFTVDGVSGNFGSTASVTLYESAGGSIPSYSALGTTTSLASVDAVEEFSVQTSTYAPEFGRQPGAQVSIITRSGTNQFHGSAFDYLRNSVLDANNWFADAAGLPKAAERQNDFGFTLGGPVFLPKFGGTHYYSGKDKTFFFVSYEGVRLRQPAVSPPLQVPSLAARQSATGVIKDLLNAFPLPTSPALASDPDVSPYVANYSNPLTLNATSFRVDHTFSSKLTVFGRYNHAPSEDEERARFCAASCVADLKYGVDTGTVGATVLFTPRFVNDLRLNYSRSNTNQSYFIDTFGGAIVPPQSSLYPSFTTGANGYIYIELDPAGNNTLSDGLFSDNVQRQWNAVDSVSLNAGNHVMKFGVDYRRLAPISNSGNYKRSFLPDDIDDLVNNVPTFATIVAPQFILRPIYNNLSLYAQDIWRVRPRLTLTYGVRYELNPSPSEQNGHLPPTVTNVDTPASLMLAPAGTRLYTTSYANFAPRFGFAYHAFHDERTAVRGGFGTFYDLGYDFTGSAFSTGIYPFANTVNLPAVTYASPSFAVQPPPVSTSPPYPRVFAYASGFQLPYTFEYNAAVEQALSTADSVSFSYVGASGHHLGRVESLRKANPNFPRVDTVRADATSNYNSLQLEYRRRLSHGVQALASYTFAKSLDNASEESINNFQASALTYNVNQDRGPSTFDLRHTFTAAISANIPAPKVGLPHAVLGGFALDTFLRARSAPPVNILTGQDALGLGFKTVVRPDVVPGVARYLYSATAPDHIRINPAAFNGTAPTMAQRQGTLSRDALRGFNATQVDLSFRRDFSLEKSLKLQARVDAFNILNHPNFSNPDPILSDSSFGVPTQTLASGLSGLSSLYQVGGPRSLQGVLKILF